MLEHGYLLLADISGYTAYLSQSELEHANDTLRDLLKAILNAIKPPLVVSRLEGDAVFCYARRESFLQGQTLVEAVENIYFAFRHSRRRIRLNTTCTCNACSNIGTLDLKFFLHYGEYVQQDLGVQVELVGADVNLAHRLMKNHVTERTGLLAYALYTQAAVDALGLGEMAASLAPHDEEYEHLGRVRAYVEDMHAIWQRDEARRRVVITPEEAVLQGDCDLPFEPGLLWDYITKPEKRALIWRSDYQKLSDLSEGRVGPGAIYHCAHGDVVLLHTILDWNPYDYYTFSEHVPTLGTTHTLTWWLTPIENGTRVSLRIGDVQGPDEKVGHHVEMAKEFYPQTIERLCAELPGRIMQDIRAGTLVVAQPVFIEDEAIGEAVRASLAGAQTDGGQRAEKD